jgi:SRSO17 transposase
MTTFDKELLTRRETAFTTLMDRLASAFARREPRERARRYLLGLLGRTERKNGWQLAEMVHEPGPQRMQRLLNAAQWDVDIVRDQLPAYVTEQLA